MVVVLDEAADGVAAGVGGVVPRAFIVDGPVEELQMAIGENLIHVEDVGQTHFAGAHFKSTDGYLRGQAEVAAVRFAHFIRKANRLVDLPARKIRHGTQVWIAHHVEIAEAGEP